jgi:hypothetical protein
MNYTQTKTKLSILSLVAAVTIASIVGMTYLQDNIPVVEAQVPVDAMNEITTQIQSNLSTPMPVDVQRENIRQAEHLVFGKPVILDTPTTPQTLAISDDYDIMVSMLKSALIQCSQETCGDSVVASEAKELADRIIYWQETKMNLEVYTNDTTCDVNNPETCTQLNLGDEPNTFGTITTIGDDRIWDGWHREIRSPFHPYAAYTTPRENIMVPDSIANGECSVVIKEIQGIKSIVRPTQIPIWQEPWTSRSQIIGFDTIWVVDFVPAEFVKNLNFCNVGGNIVFDYEINVIIERQLTHFWKFLPSGVS